ncbi:MAG TPA: 16S rRNA (cytosine(967)-C(5))-methyltransferase RsmB [Pyrinomonadaceae bacterium]|nr:16S rRNA (cytosine(967)-C(5))-methyltransferase RsmB [Pyrinomonadaceae bacterium]
MTRRVRIVKGPGRGAGSGGGGGDKPHPDGGAQADRRHTAPLVSPARRAAFRILRRVEEEGAFAAPLLAATTGELSVEDRALCYELVLGVLRRQLWLDRLLGHLAGRDPERLDPPVRRALRLGLYQLRFLTRVPARAAVNESVNLAHAERLRAAAPLVNAVLRRAAREPELDPAGSITDPSERIAVETSHPLWLVGRWAEAFGREEAAALARANNEPAPVAFRVNPARSTEEDVIGRLRAAGASVVASKLAPGAWRAEGAAAPLRELTAEGAVYLQDEASQLVAHVLGARPGERVLDACAAPGSKTTHVAALAAGRARILAGDLHPHRLRLVLEAAARQGSEGITPAVLDAEAGLPFADETFDRALVDAPCTGTGTLRHNPEIRWRLKPADILELGGRQRRILREAARTVRRGGRLVYSTCSVEPEENEEVIADFLAGHTSFRQVSARPAPALLPGGAARTWPHRDDADGFFVAAFERVG